MVAKIFILAFAAVIWKAESQCGGPIFTNPLRPPLASSSEPSLFNFEESSSTSCNLNVPDTSASSFLNQPRLYPGLSTLPCNNPQETLSSPFSDANALFDMSFSRTPQKTFFGCSQPFPGAAKTSESPHCSSPGANRINSASWPTESFEPADKVCAPSCLISNQPQLLSSQLNTPNCVRSDLDDASRPFSLLNSPLNSLNSPHLCVNSIAPLNKPSLEMEDTVPTCANELSLASFRPFQTCSGSKFSLGPLEACNSQVLQENPNLSISFPNSCNSEIGFKQLTIGDVPESQITPFQPFSISKGSPLGTLRPWSKPIIERKETFPSTSVCESLLAPLKPEYSTCGPQLGPLISCNNPILDDVSELLSPGPLPYPCGPRPSSFRSWNTEQEEDTKIICQEVPKVPYVTSPIIKPFLQSFKPPSVPLGPICTQNESPCLPDSQLTARSNCLSDSLQLLKLNNELGKNTNCAPQYLFNIGDIQGPCTLELENCSPISKNGFSLLTPRNPFNPNFISPITSGPNSEFCPSFCGDQCNFAPSVPQMSTPNCNELFLPTTTSTLNGLSNSVQAEASVSISSSNSEPIIPEFCQEPSAKCNPCVGLPNFVNPTPSFPGLPKSRISPNFCGSFGSIGNPIPQPIFPPTSSICPINIGPLNNICPTSYGLSEILSSLPPCVGITGVFNTLTPPCPGLSPTPPSTEISAEASTSVSIEPSSHVPSSLLPSFPFTPDPLDAAPVQASVSAGANVNSDSSSPIFGPISPFSNQIQANADAEASISSTIPSPILGQMTSLPFLGPKPNHIQASAASEAGISSIVPSPKLSPLSPTPFLSPMSNEIQANAAAEAGVSSIVPSPKLSSLSTTPFLSPMSNQIQTNAAAEAGLGFTLSSPTLGLLSPSAIFSPISSQVQANAAAEASVNSAIPSPILDPMSSSNLPSPIQTHVVAEASIESTTPSLTLGPLPPTPTLNQIPNQLEAAAAAEASINPGYKSPPSSMVSPLGVPALGSTKFSPFANSLNELSEFITSIVPLIEIVDTNSPYSPNFSNFPAVMDPTVYYEIKEPIVSPIESVSVAEASSTTSSALGETTSSSSSVITETSAPFTSFNIVPEVTNSMPIEILIPITVLPSINEASSSTSIASSDVTNTIATPIEITDPNLTSSTASSTTVTEVETPASIISTSSSTVTSTSNVEQTSPSSPPIPTSLISMPKCSKPSPSSNLYNIELSPVILEFEIPSSLGSSFLPSSFGIMPPCLSTMSSSIPLYELQIPASIPAQLSCSIGSVPSTTPVVCLNVEPIPSCKC